MGAHARAPRTALAASPVDGDGHDPDPRADRLPRPPASSTAAPTSRARPRELIPALAALKAAKNAQKHLAHGVTTVRDLGGIDAVSCQVGVAIDKHVIQGSRVIAAGRALTITGGHGHNVGFAREVDGADMIRKAVREEIRGGARAIKVVATGGVLTPGIGATFTAFTPEEIAAAVDEAHKWDRSVAAHAIGSGGILNAVVAGVDSVEHCNQVTTAIAKEMKERGTFRSPTLLALRGMLEHPDEVPPYAIEKAQKLEHESPRFPAARREGGDPPRVRHRRRHARSTRTAGRANELIDMVAWGMTPLKAMQAATANGAELLRLPEVGTVETGKVADLVLYGESPLEDITATLQPMLVLKDGAVVHDVR